MAEEAVGRPTWLPEKSPVRAMLVTEGDPHLLVTGFDLATVLRSYALGVDADKEFMAYLQDTGLVIDTKFLRDGGTLVDGEPLPSLQELMDLGYRACPGEQYVAETLALDPATGKPREFMATASCRYLMFRPLSVHFAKMYQNDPDPVFKGATTPGDVVAWRLVSKESPEVASSEAVNLLDLHEVLHVCFKPNKLGVMEYRAKKYDEVMDRTGAAPSWMDADGYAALTVAIESERATQMKKRGKVTSFELVRNGRRDGLLADLNEYRQALQSLEISRGDRVLQGHDRWTDPGVSTPEEREQAVLEAGDDLPSYRGPRRGGSTLRSEEQSRANFGGALPFRVPERESVLDTINRDASVRTSYLVDESRTGLTSTARGGGYVQVQNDDQYAEAVALGAEKVLIREGRVSEVKDQRVYIGQNGILGQATGTSRVYAGSNGVVESLHGDSVGVLKDQAVVKQASEHAVVFLRGESAAELQDGAVGHAYERSHLKCGPETSAETWGTATADVTGAEVRAHESSQVQLGEKAVCYADGSATVASGTDSCTVIDLGPETKINVTGRVIRMGPEGTVLEPAALAAGTRGEMETSALAGWRRGLGVSR